MSGLRWIIWGAVVGAVVGPVAALIVSAELATDFGRQKPDYNWYRQNEIVHCLLGALGGGIAGLVGFIVKVFLKELAIGEETQGEIARLDGKRDEHPR